MDRNRWIIFVALCLILLGGLYFINRTESVDVSDIDSNKIITETADGQFADNVYGNPDAKVVLFEYGDFQCPGCGAAAGPIQDLKMEYEQDMAFVYRHFPLVSIHPNALSAATVAEAAGEQDKFWQMHDLLFVNQTEWSNASTSDRSEIFAGYARQIGLDIDAYNQSIGSQDIADKINFQRSLGRSINVESTPTFILNGEKVGSEVVSNLTNGDGSQIRQLIDDAIDE